LGWTHARTHTRTDRLITIGHPPYGGALINETLEVENPANDSLVDNNKVDDNKVDDDKVDDSPVDDRPVYEGLE
jgi:hypothetical protein